MALVVPTGFAPLDRPHRDLERCIEDLATAVRARDPRDVRGRICLIQEKLAEHFTEEELLMRATGWSLVGPHADSHARILLQVRHFERRLAVQGLSHELTAWGLIHLPELIRFHCIVSDFGFGKFALGQVAASPPSRERRGPGSLGR